MKNNAIISLHSKQILEGDEDVIELQTEGKFAERDGRYFISYKESELTGFEDTVTTIKVSPDKVRMSRSGKYNMTMTYRKGEKNLCYYETMYGGLAVAVDTREIVNELTADGGRLSIDFLLDTDNVTFAHNQLSITIQKEH